MDIEKGSNNHYDVILVSMLLRELLIDMFVTLIHSKWNRCPHRVYVAIYSSCGIVFVVARFFLKFLSNLVLSLNDRFDKGKDHK